MRGNTTTSNFFRLLPGFIPAHAGNTVPYGHVPGLCQVHPRSRGEYDGVITSIGLNLGSPVTLHVESNGEWIVEKENEEDEWNTPARC